MQKLKKKAKRKNSFLFTYKILNIKKMLVIVG